MAAEQVDFTAFWRRLSVAVVESSTEASAWRQVADLFLDQAAWQAWQSRYLPSIESISMIVNQCQERMYKVNPKYVLRNHLGGVCHPKI
jgi:serine/tyrosine/threonine adenylyltransferase